MGEGRRSTRKRTNPYTNQFDSSKVSSSHYVGYVEDGESIDMIMKKFEELERFKQEAANLNLNVDKDEEEEVFGLFNMLEPKSKPKGSNMNQNSSNEINDLTEAQLEELFIRTSAFSLDQAANEPHDESYYFDELEAEEYSSEFELDEYVDMDDDEWLEEYEGYRKPKSGVRRTSSGKSRKVFDREAVLRKYRELQTKDSAGNMLALKKVQLTDPSLPSYVKVPPNLLPLSWARRINPLIVPVQPTNPNSLYFNFRNDTERLLQLGTDFQAILMDPPLLMNDETIESCLPHPYPPHRKPIYFNQLKKFPIDKMIQSGFLMVWIEKRHLAEVLELCTETWGLRYVENVAWVHYHLDNTIAAAPCPLPTVFGANQTSYLRSSKSTLLIFRKDNDIDLRHQRSPDCIFDYLRPQYTPDDPLNSSRIERPKFIYELIETLLPGHVAKPESTVDESQLRTKTNPYKQVRFLELWAPPARAQTVTDPWLSVVELDSPPTSTIPVFHGLVNGVKALSNPNTTSTTTKKAEVVDLPSSPLSSLSSLTSLSSI